MRFNGEALRLGVTQTWASVPLCLLAEILKCYSLTLSRGWTIRAQQFTPPLASGDPAGSALPRGLSSSPLLGSLGQARAGRPFPLCCLSRPGWVGRGRFSHRDTSGYDPPPSRWAACEALDILGAEGPDGKATQAPCPSPRHHHYHSPPIGPIGHWLCLPGLGKEKGVGPICELRHLTSVIPSVLICP